MKGVSSSSRGQLEGVSIPGLGVYLVQVWNEQSLAIWVTFLGAACTNGLKVISGTDTVALNEESVQ